MNGDYTSAGFLFKARKALRYVMLFGLMRTLVKIRGQYHMKADGEVRGPLWMNPGCKSPKDLSRNVAMIGCGNYAFSNIAYYLSKANPRFLRYAYDSQQRRAVSLCKAYSGAAVIDDWRTILTDPLVKIVFIASNHATHAEYAVACIEAGKHVHIEKPHVVTQEQLERLVTAMKNCPQSKVFLGFNRPKSRLFKYLTGFLAQESGPLMINWFVAGHEIADGHWYFDEKEGGRVLGNLCHWTDLTIHLVTLEKSFPCRIISATPAGAKSDFVVSVIFADESCATITFSAKGHTFEGVREILNLHKGNVLATLSDFETLTVDIVESKKRVSLLHRDHGHEANLVHSLRGVSENGPAGEDISYVAATAKFFLAIRQAIDTGKQVELSWEEINGVTT